MSLEKVDEIEMDQVSKSELKVGAKEFVPATKPKTTSNVEPICKFFSTPGGCLYGEFCSYRHENPKTMLGEATNRINDGEQPLCKFFLRSLCLKGKNCEFKHSRNKNSKRGRKPTGKFSKNSNYVHKSHSKKIPDSVSHLEYDGILKCGDCDWSVMEANPKKAGRKLTMHLVNNFKELNEKHVEVFQRLSKLTESLKCSCNVCSKYCNSPQHLFFHYVEQSKGMTQQARKHEKELEAIAAFFLYRYALKEDSKENRESKEEEEDWASNLQAHMTITDEMVESVLGSFVTRRFLDELSDDEFEERCMNYGGYSNDEVDELLCQGIKPWDDEADAALEVLYGGF